MTKIKSTAHRKKSYKHKPRGISHKDFAKVYWPYIPLVLVIGLLLSLCFNTGALRPSLTNPTAKTLDYALSMNIERLLDETNKQRTQNGDAPLKLNNKLYAAAQAKADDMAGRNYWSHYTPDGQAPWVFVTEQDYDYSKLGENLATGFLNEEGAVKGWMASPGHRRNLLDPDFTEVGFGVANSASYTSAGGGPMTIVVAMYGRPLTMTTNTQPDKPAQPETAVASEHVMPANTRTLSPDQVNSGSKLSAAQLALAGMPFGSFATGLFIAVTIAAVGLWMTKHAVAVRRAWAYGEAFMVRHPVIDIGLLVVAALSMLLTRTAGFVG